MAIRLKKILNCIISDNQAAFVPKRMIHDNIIIVHESFHYLKKKKKGSRGEFGLKINMNKAYDRVELDFFGESYGKYGF